MRAVGGEPGASPDGAPTRISPHQDDDVVFSLRAENNGAALLADRDGYRVKQNPSAEEVAQSRLRTGDSGNPRKNPDYLIEGRVFDCYAPTNPDKDVRGVWAEVKRKVDVGQTQRVVMNLQHWRGDVSDLRQQFNTWPIENLKESKAITPDGDIIQIVPDLDRK